MKTLTLKFAFLILIVSLAVTCRKDEAESDIQFVNKEIYNLMKEVYLWYDHLPEVDPASYPSPEVLMKDLRYPAYDRWSTVITKTEYNQYFEEGQMIGHGFMLSLDANDNIRVAFIYRETDAWERGVRRSWIITRVNNTPVNPDNVFTLLGPSEAGRTNDITFLDENGNSVTLSLTKEVIHITPVLYSNVIQHGNSRVGYLVFQDFIETAITELDSVFTSLAGEDLDEMIVDMRYNGGGSVKVAEHLAGWLIGKNNGDQPFINFRHNNRNSRWDTTLYVPVNANGLSFSRIFFIGTESTASASELIISGVEPYLTETILAGSTTHGKPVGMYAYPFINYDYVVLPVTFQYTNADDEGDFYNGLAPDLDAKDDLAHDFGNPEEESLKAVLDYISNGEASPAQVKSTQRPNRPIKSNSILNDYLKAY